MWRAWGALLLALASQDLDRPHAFEDHEIRFCPPSGWTKKLGADPTIAKFIPPDKVESPCEIVLVHYFCQNPTPLKTFGMHARDYITEKLKVAKIAGEKDLTIGGRPALQLVFVRGESLQIKTIVQRTNLQYYLLDAMMAEADAPKYRAAVEKSITSLEIVKSPLTSEERSAHARVVQLLRGARLDPALLGEQWHAVHLGARKVGYQRTKLTDAEGKYALEVDLKNDFGDGGKDEIVVRGSFSPDGKFQKFDAEQTKTNKDQRWQFRASATLSGGQLKVSRDMNGFKEEKALAVDEGVVFDDMAEVLRRILAGSGKGSYLMRTMSVYDDEPGLELLEVNAMDTVEIGGQKLSAQVVFAQVDRRKNLTYYFGADRRVIRLGGAKEVFSMRASTQEEALKP